MNINALVVDDSGIMRKMVISNLKKSKLAAFEFDEAVDGQDALEKYDPDKHQMLFVDWNMPNMNGLEFIMEARAKTDHHIPIVMITTESTIGKVEEAMDKGGVDTFICKPFNVEILTIKLTPLLERITDNEANYYGTFE